jgi:ribulose 1,5-bisphosphate synthetase/thiazole synthase
MATSNMSTASTLDRTPISSTTATIEGTPRAQVIVVGAGPVGLFLALKIALQGIHVVVLDAEPEIVKSPRAITYPPHHN